MTEKQEPTQRTQPSEGDPVTIPVPKRSAWDRLLHKVATPEPADDEDKPAT